MVGDLGSWQFLNVPHGSLLTSLWVWVSAGLMHTTPSPHVTSMGAPGQVRPWCVVGRPEQEATGVGVFHCSSSGMCKLVNSG